MKKILIKKILRKKILMKRIKYGKRIKKYSYNLHKSYTKTNKIFFYIFFSIYK